MDIRDRILAAANRVYAVHGFRGSTTRRIALEAGVNEVTIFRTFGSKGALFQQLLHDRVGHAAVSALPDEPTDPERELTEWCTRTLAHMRESRSFIRKAIGELEERPDAALSACEGPNCAGQALGDYVTRLCDSGLADPDADVSTAVAMLMSSLFGDAMCRELMPDAFPQPMEDAPARYVRAFMRAVGVTSASVTHLQERTRPASLRARRLAP